MTNVDLPLPLEKVVQQVATALTSNEKGKATQFLTEKIRAEAVHLYTQMGCPETMEELGRQEFHERLLQLFSRTPRKDSDSTDAWDFDTGKGSGWDKWRERRERTDE